MNIVKIKEEWFLLADPKV